MTKQFTLFFISTVPPFGYEVNSLLALPAGFRHRVRYRDRWIAVEKPHDLVGSDGLVSLRVFETAKIIPLRRVTIDNVTKVGSLIYMSLRLQELIEFSSNRQIQKKQLDECNQLMENMLASYGNVPGKNIGAAVVPAADPAYFIRDNEFLGDETERDLNAWGSLTELLGEIEFYRDFDFVRIVDIADDSGKRVSTMTSTSETAYQLVGEETYTLTLLQVVPMSSITKTFQLQNGSMKYPESRQKIMELHAQADVVNFLKNSAPVETRHDIYRFRFHTIDTKQEQASAIVVTLKQESDLSFFRPLSELNIPIKIRVSRIKQLTRIVSFIFFLIAVVIILLPELLQNLLPIIQFTSSSGGFSPVQRIALLVMVITSWSIPRAERWISSLFGI